MNKRILFASVVLLAGAPVLAEPVLAQAPAPAPAPGAPMLAVPRTAAEFRRLALMSDAFEIAAGQLALERSRNASVRRFANRMVADHQAVTQALLGGQPGQPGQPGAAGTLGTTAAGVGIGALAGGPVGAAIGAGIGASAGMATGSIGRPGGAQGPVLDPRHAAIYNELATLRGRAFDRAYARAQLQAHQEAVALYAGFAQQGADPAMAAWARQILPDLEAHLLASQRLAARLGA